MTLALRRFLRAGAIFCTVTSAVALTSGVAGYSSAVAQNQTTVNDIQVTGTQRVDASTVLSYLPVGVGDPVTQVQLDQALSALFETGLFDDVVIEQDGGVIRIDVVENPIINRIAFEGNRRIDNETLQAEIQSRPRVVFTRTRVESDVQRIQDVYQASGRFAVAVEPQIIELDQNRVDLVFEIEEGPLTTIQRIDFVGNRAFSDSRLRDAIESRESRWWRLLTTSDRYDPDQVSVDEERLRRYYTSRGYADFRVNSAIAELTPDREGFFVTFSVDEGERYRFGEIDVASSLPDVDFDALDNVLTTREGRWFSSEEVEESIGALTEALGDQQFAFVEINPVVMRDRENRTIGITYEIDEGPRVFVERVNITGNTRTVDRVIRREVRLAEGDPFSSSRLQDTERRIRNLGFFEKVEISTRQGSAPDQIIVDINVEEQPTGELTLGAGFSTADGPLGEASIRERNLLGRGQDLRLAFSVSGKSQQVDLSFTEPYFLGRDLAAGFDLFRTERDRQEISSYDEELTGFGLRLGYPLGPRLRQTVRYNLSEQTIRNIGPNVSRFIRDQEGTTVTSLVGQNLIYDTRDSSVMPTEGYRLTVGTDFAGLGGDIRYFRAVGTGSVYYPVFDDVVLNVAAEAGHIEGLGQDVRVTDRFFVGGRNLRGFRTAGIGPRDGDGNALGGKTYAVGTVEASFPIGLPNELGVRGRTFSDVGFLTNIDETSDPNATGADRIFEEDSVRLSVGVGLSWQSPLGPLQFDFGFPVMKEDFDREENFRFSFGTRF